MVIGDNEIAARPVRPGSPRRLPARRNGGRTSAKAGKQGEGYREGKQKKQLGYGSPSYYKDDGEKERS